MVRIFAFVLFFFFAKSYAQVDWVPITKAFELQQKVPKKILILFYESDCNSCQMLEKQTFGSLEIQSYIREYYYAVKFDIHSTQSFSVFGKDFSGADSREKNPTKYHSFARFMNITSLPSIAFLDEQSMPITTIQGSWNAKELEPYLIFFGRGDYLKITSSEEWENYRKKIKSKIKN
ncbi:thioredoxin family protein [Chryseobacterium sp. A301]